MKRETRVTLEVLEVMAMWRALDDAEKAVWAGHCSIEVAAERFHVDRESLELRFREMPAEPF